MKKSMPMHTHAYAKLVAMVLLSFLAMYALMYAMVDRFANVYPNFNQFYMAGLMTAPMLVLEIVLMGAMYELKALNVALATLGAAALLAFWFLIRQQVAITDAQFLKSMIPHHAGAILMCERASVADPRIVELCRGIVAGQQAEIDQMKAILQTLPR
jgi:hypothetical protein